jgi:hypothetical protein
MEYQRTFILDKLESYSVCPIQDKYTKTIKKVSTTAVRSILNHKFIHGADMKAVLCLIDTLLLSTTDIREYGLPCLSENVRKWIINMEKMDVKSVQGFVYLSDILTSDIQVVIKVPKEIDGIDGLVKEYFLGINTINNLRYYIPTFMYTLGAFLCPVPKEVSMKKLCSSGIKTAFVMYEKIPGQSMQEMLMSNKINFNQFIEIFIQILVSLEIAQLESQFTHFDLHTGNVMIRPVDNYSYSVCIENSTYNIITDKFIPVIIDYGFVTSKVEGVTVGEFGYEQHGMMPFMVPGYDMYKFLIHCAKNANNSLKTKIIKLFNFYGNDDRYKIAIKGEDSVNSKIKKATDEYCRNGTYTSVAKYTPLMFLNWLLEHNIYSKVVSKYLKVKERREYIPLHFSSTIQEYDDIFKHSQKGRDNALKIVDKCLRVTSSYIMTMYNVMILLGYNKYLKDKQLNNKINNINKVVQREKEYMIDIDMTMLYKYKQIPLPTKGDVNRAYINMLKFHITQGVTKKKIQAIEALDIFKFYYSLKPYLQFVYTIREINADDIFSEFLDEFLTSPHYLLYSETVIDIMQSIRWSICIQSSLV